MHIARIIFLRDGAEARDMALPYAFADVPLPSDLWLDCTDAQRRTPVGVPVSTAACFIAAHVARGPARLHLFVQFERSPHKSRWMHFCTVNCANAFALAPHFAVPQIEGAVHWKPLKKNNAQGGYD